MISKKLLIIIVCLCLVLAVRFRLAYTSRHIYHAHEQLSFDTLLLSDIDTSTAKAQFSTILPDSFPPQRVNVIMPTLVEIHYGQTLHISGNLSQKMLKNNSLAMTISLSKITIHHSISDYLLYPLYYLRRRLLTEFQMTLSDIDRSLLLGIVFGIKTNMPQAFSHKLQATGVTHVIAASGMNVTMVAALLSWIFGKYFPRKVAVVGSIVGVSMYAVFAGLQSSILRAAIMGIAVFSAQLIGRQYHSIYILFLTGFFMLLISPQALFDVGFQLSVLSTLGIITIQPMLTHRNIVTEDVSTTVAAQIATVPILVATFGQYNILSIVVNGLVLWTIPPLMLIGSCGALVGMLLPEVGRFVLVLAVPLLWFFESVVSFFAGIPALLTLSTVSPLLIVGYYFLVIAIVSVGYLKRGNNEIKVLQSE